MTCIIETKQVSKCYGAVKALDQVNLHVHQGDIYGLIGDNGAGKSTLLKILSGLSFATKGEVLLWGCHEEGKLNRMRRRLGCIVEQPGLFPGLTAEQTLNYYCIQKGIPDRHKASRMLEMTGLTQKRDCLCKKLSLGQKQRLGLAIAMLGEPSALILDEPINGLDPSGIVEMRSLLQKLNEQKNITIIISSHILRELQQIATCYGFLSKGRLMEEISAKALKEKCAGCIEIKVSDIQRFSVLFEQSFPKEHFSVLPDNTLRIHAPASDAALYSRLAAQNGLDILAMNTRSSSLEDYYIKLKGEATEQC